MFVASVCLCFQVHQPFRLRRYSVFDSGHNYFDAVKNREILLKVAHKCYLPGNAMLLDLVRRHEGRFRFAFAMTGVVLDQFDACAPEVLASFQALVETGCVELVNETYYHSLASLYSRREFAEQVHMQEERLARTFGQKPTVFRNTELIYNNDIADFVGKLGYRGMLCEGVDDILGYRSPTFLYHPPNRPEMTLLLKHYRLSDDIAFRFSDRAWPEWPLTAEKYARWVNQVNGNGYVVNLFMDYETVGEHQWADTGIFEFLHHLPGEIMKYPDNDFRTPSEIVGRHLPSGVYDVPRTISWADTERDLSAWVGNAMQASAVAELYKFEQRVLATGDAELIDDWRRLQTSDHFYYMCTKYFADGDVHKYFNPYESPYDSYINFMNIMDNLRGRIKQRSAVAARAPRRTRRTAASDSARPQRRPPTSRTAG